jgi:hypothetical protein
VESDTPEIRKYKKRFNSDILCAALWGVNLLIGTDSGLMLLDRSGQGKGGALDHQASASPHLLESLAAVLSVAVLSLQCIS